MKSTIVLLKKYYRFAGKILSSPKESTVVSPNTVSIAPKTSDSTVKMCNVFTKTQIFFIFKQPADSEPEATLSTDNVNISGLRPVPVQQPIPHNGSDDGGNEDAHFGLKQILG